MKKIILLIVIAFQLIAVSCEPRIELDEGEWGDHAFIENVQIFKLDIQNDVKLQEWYENETVVTGVRQFPISSGVDINNDTYTVDVTVPAEEDLTRVGIKFWHKAVLIEPLNGAPKAGTVNDFSAKSFKYRLHSADGTTHDWTVNITD